MYTYPLPQSTNGLTKLCEIHKATNGWMVTTYKDISLTVDDVKERIQGAGGLAKLLQGQAYSYEEPWKQTDFDDEEQITNTAKLIVETQKPTVETHLFLKEEEMLAFLAKLVGI